MGEKTPNSLLEIFGLKDSLVEKEKCSKDRVDRIGENLPLVLQYPEILGSGDWGHTRSSGGTVVLGWGQEHVVKVPLGGLERNPYDWATQQRRMMGFFAGVSAPSIVIIARVDNSLPKPVVVQKRVNGRPACETPLSHLLNPETLVDMGQIVRRVRQVYFNEGVLDLCGQHFSSRTLSRTVGFLPFFSDNIMIETEGGALFTDNTPDCTFDRTKGKSLTRKAVNMARFAMVESLISFLIFLCRGRDWVERLKQSEVVAKASIRLSESSTLME